MMPISVSPTNIPPSPQKLPKNLRLKRTSLIESSSQFDFTLEPRVGEKIWDPTLSESSHAGKWPIEEEIYANRLVLEFAAGALEDCEDGTTLRSYLSTKLRCAPMRISKKFAGKSIGSKVFFRQEGSRDALLADISCFQSSNSNSLQRRITRITRKEKGKNQRPRKRNRSLEFNDLDDQFLEHCDRLENPSSDCDTNSDASLSPSLTPVKKPRILLQDKVPKSENDFNPDSPLQSPVLSRVVSIYYLDIPIPISAIFMPIFPVENLTTIPLDFDHIKTDFDMHVDANKVIKEHDDVRSERSFHTLGGYSEWCEAISYFSTQEMVFFSKI